MKPPPSPLIASPDRARRRLAWALLPWVLGPAAVAATAAADLAGWSHWQTLDVPAPGLVRVSLPPATLDAARPGLEDLRLIDPAGGEVPYLVEPIVSVGATRHPAGGVAVILEPEATVVTLETGLTQPLDGVTLTSPAERLIKAVQVEGSTDRRTWTLLASGLPVFREPGGAAQLHLPLPPGVWPFLRIRVDDRGSPPVPFTGAEVHRAPPTPEPAEDVAVGIMERIESPGETRLTLDFGAAHLPLTALEIVTGERLFSRPAVLATRQVEDGVIRERVLAQGLLQRTTPDGVVGPIRLELRLDQPTPDRRLLLLIRNADSPPLGLEALHARRRPVRLAFIAARPGSHWLYTGNPRCAAPRYDLPPIDLASRGAVPTLVPGALARNPGYQAPATLPQVQDYAGTLDVKPWSYRKPVRLERPGPQQIELDPEVLARAQPGLQDLRLVRGGRQLPYVLERTSLLRTLEVGATSAPDPERPTLSGWALHLPEPGLPITRISCTASTSLFRRDVVAFEHATDSRGARYRRQLGVAAWVQAPDRRVETLSLALSVPPTTDTVLLETDNGDNPPLALGGFAVAYPVTRLYFKAGQPGELHLYYGNPRAATPQYDLALVAAQLLAADLAPATLGPGEQLRRSPWTPGTPGRGGIIFWGALVLVVVGLLLVMTRLLPRSEPPPE
jgi:hypothetical protein